MNKLKTIAVTLILSTCLILLILLVAACTDSLNTNSLYPIAVAGEDRTLRVGNYTYLNGSESILTAGIRLTYIWRESATNPVELRIPEFCDSIMVSFTQEGTYKFSLQVYDGYNFSEPDDVIITVLPRTNVIFEDPRLEVWVRYALKVPTRDLTEMDLQSLEELNTNNITSLNGVERCINLSKLSTYNLGQGGLANITPIASLTNLESLSLVQEWHLTDLAPMSQLNLLTYLRLVRIGTNDITPLANSTLLNDLSITDCQLIDISIIENFNNLARIDLSRNEISNIEALNNKPHLKYVSLYSNNITNIKPLADNTPYEEYQSISLNNNPLDSLSTNVYIPQLQARGVNVIW